MDDLQRKLFNRAEELVEEGALEGAAELLARVEGTEAEAKLKEVQELLRKRGEAEQKERDEREKTDRQSSTNVYRFGVKFADVIGHERLKKELLESVGDAIKRPDLFDKYGIERSFGMIMYGFPGVGKTTLIKGLSGELDVDIILAKINEIIDQYRGESEKNVARLFQEARDRKPCILFMDEFDTIGGRKAGLGREDTAQRNIVNVLKQEMDGIQSSREDTFVIAATNAPWDIEAELKRSGRFSKIVYVPLPKRGERKRLFRLYMRDHRPSHIGYGRLARATFAYSPADIKRICDDAAKRAKRRERETGREQHTTMGDLLAILRDKSTGKSSVWPWLNRFVSEGLGYVDTKKVGSKSVSTIKEGKIPRNEREQYKDLIKEVDYLRKNRGRAGIMRLIALYVI